MRKPLYPLLLAPNLVQKVWGGRKLASVMHKALPTDAPYGESWELHDTATVENGSLAGQPLSDLLAAYGTDLVGAHNDPAAGFPLLAKLLDASDWLSVQVHPNDEQAAQLEGEPRGKTEAWIVLAAEPDAQLVIGVEPGTNNEVMAQAIRNGELEDHLVYRQVQAGDVLLLEANTVHAIGPGLLIYEIQQSSDTTYRLYDWNRMGMDGTPRELHIEKGVQVSNTEYLPQITRPAASSSDDVVTLVAHTYFRTDQHRLNHQNGPHTIETGGTFHALTCTAGDVSVQAAGEVVQLTTGRTVLIPAALAAFTLSGAGQVLRSWQPTG